MRKQGLIIGVLAAILVIASAFLYGWERPIPKSDRAQTFSPALVERGAMLASAGFCDTCHTVNQSKPFAGGRPLATGFGTIYTTNITPDPETGIGSWTEAAFVRAMRKGVSRDGSHLFPAFPFDHFASLTDEDVSALYAYFMTRTPVREENKPNTIPFPLNIRLLQAGWKLLFFHSSPIDESSPDQPRRGEYLVEALSHCGACHTPRNALGAERTSEKFAGASIDGWYAPALSLKNPTPMQWNRDEFYSYLRHGGTALHGVAAGPMAPVVRGLSPLPDSDINAMADYLSSISGVKGVANSDRVVAAATSDDLKTTGSTVSTTGERLYSVACATCHFNSATGVKLERPELGLNSALFADTPDNLIHVILDGISARDGLDGIAMPSFRKALSDAEVASIAEYLRSSRTERPPWAELEEKVKQIRNAGADHD